MGFPQVLTLDYKKLPYIASHIVKAGIGSSNLHVWNWSQHYSIFLKCNDCNNLLQSVRMGNGWMIIVHTT